MTKWNRKSIRRVFLTTYVAALSLKTWECAAVKYFFYLKIKVLKALFIFTDTFVLIYFGTCTLLIYVGKYLYLLCYLLNLYMFYCLSLPILRFNIYNSLLLRNSWLFFIIWRVQPPTFVGRQWRNFYTV